MKKVTASKERFRSSPVGVISFFERKSMFEKQMLLKTLPDLVSPFRVCNSVSFCIHLPR